MKTAMLWICFASISIMAAPAVQRPHYFQQPDGTVFEGNLKGDEYLNWIETRSGKIVIFDAATRQYEPAMIRGSNLVGNGKRYEETSDMPSLKSSEVKALWKARRSAEVRRRNAPRN